MKLILAECGQQQAAPFISADHFGYAAFGFARESERVFLLAGK